MISKFFVILLLIMSVASENQKDNENNLKNNNNSSSSSSNRVKRAEASWSFWGFFSTFGQFVNILVDQYQDTKGSLNKVYTTLQDGFSDTATTTPRSLTSARTDNSTETTTEKFRITRFEAGRILGRNYRGLQKVLRLELNDALNQSNYNIADYQREIQNAIGRQTFTGTKVVSKTKRKTRQQAPKWK